MANKFFTSIKARYFASVASRAVDIGADGDVEPRIAIDAGGKITWGPGDDVVDVSLYRDDIGVLKTDGALNANSLFVNGVEVSGAPAPLDISYVSSNYTLQLSDAEGLIHVTGASVGITVPNDSTVNFPVGTRIQILTTVVDASLLTDGDDELLDDDDPGNVLSPFSFESAFAVSAASGVNLNTSSSLTVTQPWILSTLLKYQANSWVFVPSG